MELANFLLTKLILELKQHLWFKTPYGEARCLFVIDYGQEDDLYWVCVQQDGEHKGQLWTWHNSEVKMAENKTMLRA